MKNQMTTRLRHLIYLFIFTLLCTQAHASPPDEQSIYQLEGKTIEGKHISFEEYRGKVLLITNISLKCGTTPQLKDLQELYERYSERGLVVLGFPSNDFTGESLEDHEGVKKFCKKNFGVTFPIFYPDHVKGSKIQPIFKFLTTSGDKKIRGDVGFNLEKFLVGKDGHVQYRFGPFTSATSHRLIRSFLDLLGA